MRILSENDVERLIDPDAAIAAMADAYRRQSAGLVLEPGRLDLSRSAPKGNVLVLGGHAQEGLFALKANMHVYADGPDQPRKAASMMLLWDGSRCEPRALIATTRFNNHRTAAGLAAAAQALAPPAAKTLVMYGAGKIAPSAIRYLARVRAIETILIVGKGTNRATQLAQSLRNAAEFAACDIRATDNADEAAAQADVIVTLTTASMPVFDGSRARSGALVILAGANRPEAREADDALIARARVIVDHRATCLARAGDLVIPMQSGHLRPEQVHGEIGQVLHGASMPSGNHDVTVFKSMGVIAQDMALSELVLARAEREAVGLQFDREGDLAGVTA